MVMPSLAASTIAPSPNDSGSSANPPLPTQLLPIAPPPATEDERAKEAGSYTVQKGDTLALIAKKTGAKQPDIIAANRISDPSLIKVGQTLIIPGGK